MFSSPAGRLVLRSTTPLRVDGNAVVAQPVLAEGESIELVLSWDGDVVPLRPGQVADWLAATETYWRRWIAGSRYQGRYREMVERSALVLKMLVHDPTGALVAAPNRCRNRSAAAATGTTGTPGSATPHSPCMR